MCCGPYRVSNRVWAEKPVDPSPTPWNFHTWGFFCDNCMRFFDLTEDGKVITSVDKDGECWASYEHKCGQSARYITYDRTKQ